MSNQSAPAAPLRKPTLRNKRQFKQQIPISDATIWRWEKRGFLNPIRIGRAVFFSQEEIDNLAEHGTEAA